tara:strand:- start:674 stop:1156 length:483 start_codon:yes stop_codon:yes gene_type:complete
MKKNLILPLFGLIVLGICAFLFLDQSEKKEKLKTKIPELIFETPGFYSQEKLKKEELSDLFIINFFASWCKPCLAEHPLLMEMQAKGIKIIGINFRDDEENLIKWINEHGNPFFHVIIDDGSIAYDMGLIGVPETYFISEFNIQTKIQGPLFYEDIEKYL